MRDKAIELARHLRLPDDFIRKVENYTQQTILLHTLRKFRETDSPTKRKMADALKEIDLHEAALKVFGKCTWCVDS